jgi:hypothetical protein
MHVSSAPYLSRVCRCPESQNRAVKLEDRRLRFSAHQRHKNAVFLDGAVHYYVLVEHKHAVGDFESQRFNLVSIMFLGAQIIQILLQLHLHDFNDERVEVRGLQAS